MKPPKNSADSGDTYSLSRRALLRGGSATALGLGALGTGLADLPIGTVRSGAATRHYLYFWLRNGKLDASDGDANDRFGESVALNSGFPRALVGAPEDEDPNGSAAGSVYWYTGSGRNWSQKSKITAPNGDDSDQFGASVALSGNGITGLVGAPGDEDPNGPGAGSAHVFTLSGSARRQAKLTASGGDKYDEFGASVALDGNGNTALVGAPGKTRGTGSAYLFDGAGGNWREMSTISAPDSGESFGTSVALNTSGDVALVGAPGDWGPGINTGAAYVFTRSGSNWSQQAKLEATDADELDRFGSSVALDASGDTALIGAPSDEDPNGYSAGSAYVFTRSGTGWGQQAKLDARDGDDDDSFGKSVALDEHGDTAFVGAPGDEDPNKAGSGSMYHFTRSGSSWHQQTKLAPGDGDSGDRFGTSVALGRRWHTVLAGARRDEDPNGSWAGSAYVFGGIALYVVLEPVFVYEPAVFDASDSTFTEGRTVAAYEWDWDGDGEYEEVTEEPRVAHTFASAGEHDVSLRVRSEEDEVSAPTTRTVYARRRIDIDVRPGEEENYIEPDSEEPVPVAVRESSGFEDLERIDPTTVRFGDTDDVLLGGLGRPGGGARPLGEEGCREDDGSARLFYFSQERADFDMEDTTGTLMALTEEGVPLVGSDRVVVDG